LPDYDSYDSMTTKEPRPLTCRQAGGQPLTWVLSQLDFILSVNFVLVNKGQADMRDEKTDFL